VTAPVAGLPPRGAAVQAGRAAAASSGTHWLAGLRDACSLAAPFWRTDPIAWAQLAGVVTLSLGAVWVNVRFSEWNNTFYDALQAHDLKVFWQQLGVFGLLATGYIVMAVLRLVLQQRLVMRWREGLTGQLLARWLRPGTAYRLSSASVDNPDQRIADDVRSFVSDTLDLGLGLLSAAVTLVSFVAILWRLSGSLAVPWPAPGWSLPGYMVWVAIAYSLVGSAVVRWLGAPLVPTNARQQQVEADFRYALVQVRDHAEAIALARGEPAEHRRLGLRFDAIRDNWDLLIRYTKRLTWFSAGFGQLANVFPLLAAAPRYFAGHIQLGGLMQTAQAFGQVQGALSWFVDAYTSLAGWRATVHRLAVFRDALASDEGSVRTAPAPAPVDASGTPQSGLRARHLVVALPGGPSLLELEELTLQPAEWLLLTGPSGSGKSSLLRMLGGLWPIRHGRVRMPVRAMLVPQRPYLPHGTLAELLAYPEPAQQFHPDAMRCALEQAELSNLVPSLELADAWSRRLSPGEQQRLQFARIFLHGPRWLLLDEATSALDPATQERLLRRLRETLPTAGVLSIGHREELRPLHDRLLRVKGRRLVPDEQRMPAGFLAG
jgi:putative ATP-binding cassette transporter